MAELLWTSCRNRVTSSLCRCCCSLLQSTSRSGCRACSGSESSSFGLPTRVRRRNRSFTQSRRDALPGRDILHSCSRSCGAPILFAAFVCVVYHSNIGEHFAEVFLERRKPRTAGRGWGQLISSRQEQVNEQQSKQETNPSLELEWGDYPLEDRHFKQLLDAYNAKSETPRHVGPGNWAEEQICFLEDSTEYCLPQLFGACCVRSGSTSLAAYLDAHPLMSFGERKEHQAFRFSPFAGQQYSEMFSGPVEHRRAFPSHVSFQHGFGESGYHPMDWGVAYVNFTSTFNPKQVDDHDNMATQKSTQGALFLQSDGITPKMLRPYGVSMRSNKSRKKSTDPNKGISLKEEHVPLNWRSYARQFPRKLTTQQVKKYGVDASVSGVDGTAVSSRRLPREERVLRFDFDPTYFGTIYSLASAQAIIALQSAAVKELELAERSDVLFSSSAARLHSFIRPKILLVLRDPFHQACSKLVGKLEGKSKNGDPRALARAAACWEAAGALVSDSHEHVEDNESKKGANFRADSCERGICYEYDRFRSGLRRLRESKLCPESWVSNLHGFCYAEHIDQWTSPALSFAMPSKAASEMLPVPTMAQMFDLKRDFYAVKSEELLDMPEKNIEHTGRGSVVMDTLRFALGIDDSSAEDMRLREWLHNFHDSGGLSVQHNSNPGLTHHNQQHRKAEYGASTSTKFAKTAGEARTHKTELDVDNPQATCEAALRGYRRPKATGASYLSVCNVRLSELLEDRKWLWEPHD